MKIFHFDRTPLKLKMRHLLFSGLMHYGSSKWGSVSPGAEPYILKHFKWSHIYRPVPWIRDIWQPMKSAVTWTNFEADVTTVASVRVPNKKDLHAQMLHFCGILVQLKIFFHSNQDKRCCPGPLVVICSINAIEEEVYSYSGNKFVRPNVSSKWVQENKMYFSMDVPKVLDYWSKRNSWIKLYLMWGENNMGFFGSVLHHLRGVWSETIKQFILW